MGVLSAPNNPTETQRLSYGKGLDPLTKVCRSKPTPALSGLNPLPRSLLWTPILGFFRLARVVRHIHASQYVIGKEELAVSRNHHDLQFVRQPFGNDLINQQRILLENRSFLLHSFRIGRGGHANPVGF